jgi:hypothetical protein
VSTGTPKAKTYQSPMNLLKPDFKAGSEQRRRSASFTRLMFLGVALIVWTMVGLKVWEISLVVAERRPDELEISRISAKIDTLQEVLSKVPSQALAAREDLLMQVPWSNRLEAINALALPGQALGPYSVQKDGTMRVTGLVRDPAVYADFLDKISRVPFVTGVQSSSLVYEEQMGYGFHVIFGTLPTEDK